MAKKPPKKLGGDKIKRVLIDDKFYYTGGKALENLRESGEDFTLID